MGKVSLVTVARARLRQHLLPERHAPQICEAMKRHSDSCTKAARKLLQLFENLSNTQNMTRFFFTDFQSCSIATIVTLVAGILDRDSGYQARVAFGLDCLRRMATGNMTAQMGVRFVEAVLPLQMKPRRNSIVPAPMRKGMRMWTPTQPLLTTNGLSGSLYKSKRIQLAAL